MRYLFDTNALIALLKHTSSTLAQRTRQQRPSDIGLSSIVAHELYFGAYRSQRRTENLARLDALRFEVVPFDKEDAIAAGQIRALLAAEGLPIGPYDVLIAGQALSRNLILVSNNTREFQRVKGLRVEDWTTADD